MELGIFGLPTDMSFYDAVDYCAKAGFEALEPYPAHEFAVPDADALKAAQRLGQHAKEMGVRINCFSMGINITTGDTVRANIEKLKRYAEIAAAMGSPFLHHTLLPGLSHGRDANVTFRELLNVAVSGVREVYDAAQTFGVRAVYEDQGFVFNGCERFERFLDAVERPVGVVADLGNILFVDETPMEFVGRFAPYVAHVHVKDYIAKKSTDNYPGEEWYNTRSGGYLRGTIVGHGVNDFVACCRILINAGYTGSFSLEFDGKEDPLLADKLSSRNFRRYYAEAESMLGKGVTGTPFTV